MKTWRIKNNLNNILRSFETESNWIPSEKFLKEQRELGRSVETDRSIGVKPKDMTECFRNCTLSTISYSNILYYLAQGATRADVNFDGGNSKFNIFGISPRNHLASDLSWNISDGGLET